MTTEQLKYPIGRHQMPDNYDRHTRMAIIEALRSYPDRLFEVVQNLDDDQLDTPYREGGWTVRQVIHHVADSHMNCYVRYRWTLTEDTPVIKAYDQLAWAQLPDAVAAPIMMSIDLLAAIHGRWTLLLDHMEEEDFARKLSHPEWDNMLSLDQMVGHYAWHGAHHRAHITSLIDRMGW